MAQAMQTPAERVVQFYLDSKETAEPIRKFPANEIRQMRAKDAHSMLQSAAYAGKLSRIKPLLEKGKEFMGQQLLLPETAARHSLMHVAAQRPGQYKAAYSLMKPGTRPTFNDLLNTKASCGGSVLHFAVRNNQIGTALGLLKKDKKEIDHNAFLTAKDGMRQSLFDQALRHSKTKVMMNYVPKEERANFAIKAIKTADENAFNMGGEKFMKNLKDAGVMTTDIEKAFMERSGNTLPPVALAHQQGGR